MVTGCFLDPERRAYHRDQRFAIEAALKVASIDQQAGVPRCYASNAVDYLSTMMWLLEGETYARWQRIEEQIHEEGGSTERKLGDYERSHSGLEQVADAVRGR